MCGCKRNVTLVDFKKTVPPGGLLNPGLRTMKVNVRKLNPNAVPRIGSFANLPGRFVR